MSDQPQHAQEGAPEWMVSYADMITIMMAFFVVLYASTGASGSRDRGGKASESPKGGKEATMGSEVVSDPNQINKPGKSEKDPKAERVQRVFESLYNRFGPDWTATNCWSGGPAVARARQTASAHDDRARRGGRGESSAVLYAPKPNDTLVSGGRVLFASNADTLDPEQKQQLASVAAKLAGKLQKIELRGHTSRDPLPPGSPFHDHDDLAYARCRAVRDYLVSLSIDPRRIRLAVAGAVEPLDTTGDPVRSRQNARVDIHWLNEWLGAAATTR